MKVGVASSVGSLPVLIPTPAAMSGGMSARALLIFSRQAPSRWNEVDSGSWNLTAIQCN